MPSSIILTFQLAIVLALFILEANPLQAKDDGFMTDIRPIILKKCAQCHGPDEKAGKINFTNIADDKSAALQRKLWRKAMAQIEAGSMPQLNPTAPVAPALLLQNIICVEPITSKKFLPRSNPKIVIHGSGNLQTASAVLLKTVLRAIWLHPSALPPLKNN